MTQGDPQPVPPEGNGDEAASAGRPRRRAVHVARRASLWTLRSTLIAVILVGAAVFWVVGQRLHPPEWLRDRVEARIERSLGGMQISFGDIEMVIRKGWRPRLRLRDVVLTQPDGQIVAQLADAEASLALRPLLQGQVQPKRIVLSGALATLRRGRDGAVTLALGSAAAPVKSAEGLPQLIESWNRLLLTPQLSALVAFEVDAVTLRYEDLRSGKAWTLDGGQLRLDRDGQELRLAAGFALLSGRDYASSVEANYATRIGEMAADFGISVRDIAAPDIAAQSVALNWLDVLRAPISGALRGSVTAAGGLGPLSATLQIGEGVLQPTEATRPIPFSGARSYFTYQPETQTLIFDELSVDSAWGSSSGEGRAWLGGIENGRLNDLVGQFSVNRMSLNPAGLYDTPLQLDGASVDFRLALDPFRLTLGQMSVVDAGSAFRLSGALEAGAEGWQLSADGKVDQLTPERLLALWPATVADKPRAWVADNLTAGTMSDIDLALRLRAGEKPRIYGDFDFTGADIRYNRFLPPIHDASGEVTLDGARFVATADSGKVTAEQGGTMEIGGSSFIIPDIGAKPAPALLRLRAHGPITAVMSMLAGPPAQVLRGTTLPVALAEGSATLEGTLALPLKPKVLYEEMEFHVAAALSDVSSEVLVPGQRLAAPALRLEADQSHVQIEGTGRIGDLPVVMRWRQPIGPGAAKASRVDGQVELSQRLIDTFAIGLPEGSVSGQGTGRFTLDLGAGGPPALHLSSDLQGVGLGIPTLGWRKPEAEAGMLELDASLGQVARIERLTVQAAGLSATGSVIARAGGGLDRALLSSVKIDGWLEAGVELIGRGKAAPDVRILTGTLDLRNAPLDGEGEGGGALQVRLDRLRISDGLSLTGFQGDFTTDGGLRGTFSGNLNGQTPVTGRIEPQVGRSAIYVNAADGGGVFRSAGILNQAHGGAFALTLLPVGEASFDGRLRVTGTRVKDAPLIAALLNAVSVVGLLDEMAGQGIQFTEVEARFRLEPDRLVLLESSAVGPSIGLSMDGIYDLDRAVLNMRGVISPVYMINVIGSVLTRKGEGMIGFNYSLKGPASDPSVQVNPLSGLAPGMFREIFRGARPTLEGDEAPEAEPPRRSPSLPEGAEGGR